MITLRAKGIRWEYEDVRLMAKIIGSENAVIRRGKKFRYAPPLASILRLAEQKGAFLSKKAQTELTIAESYRREVEQLRRLKDYALKEKKAELFFPHQRADLHMMYTLNQPGYLISHQTGVGKTLEAIRYIEHRMAERIAIITPNAAKEQWYDEIKKWRVRKMPIRILDGSIGEQIHTLKTLKTGWVIGHWESLAHARKGWLSAPWGAVAADEVQFAQNRKAKRTRTLFRIAKMADTRLALSANPFSNAVNELFPVLKFLYPELYPAFWRWAHLQIQIDEGPFGTIDLSSPRRPNLLKWEIAPIVIRRTKKSVWKNLPEISRVRRTATLTRRGQREYDKLRKQFFVELKAHKGEKNILAIPSVLARITRLRQYLIDPGLLKAKEPSVKYPIVHELVKEMAGTPPVIFTMYRQAALRLQAYLAKRGLNVPVIAGGMKKKVNRLKKKFLKGKFDAIIILISVGGTALNFGKYGNVIHLDLPWNPKDFEQTEGRVDRPEEGTGKLVPTTSYRIIVKGSYEERMEDKLIGKYRDFTKVFTVADAKEFFSDIPRKRKRAA